MTRRAGPIFLRLGILLGLTFAGFSLLQAPARTLETGAAAWVARSVGQGDLRLSAGSSVIVMPAVGEPFRAIVTPSCSSLASILAIGCLAALAPDYARRRKVGAAAAAMAAIVLGNILRIAASLDIGLVAGRSSLVLFHDSIGNMFSFGYTLGGYILMLWLLLPARTKAPQRMVSVAH